MRAIILEKTGGVGNFVTKEIEKPTIKENEVLLAVNAISVNPVDCKGRGNEDLLTMIYGEQRPTILG